jgi:hypothetical protein
MNEKLPNEGKEPSIEEAIEFVGEALTEVAMMGANDSEIPELNSIMEKLKEGEYDPKEAMRRAQEIRASKMDYH